MSIFEFERVSLSYSLREGKRHVLQDLSFTVGDGEILTICGASGTGKTSLLRILAGLTPQSSGSARFRGANITAPPEGIALVFQDYSNALLRWRTVARNVALGIERRAKGAALRKQVKDALCLVGLEKYADDYPWQLSGGMQQRVQIARALVVIALFEVINVDRAFEIARDLLRFVRERELLVRGNVDALVVMVGKVIGHADHREHDDDVNGRKSSEFGLTGAQKFVRH